MGALPTPAQSHSPPPRRARSRGRGRRGWELRGGRALALSLASHVNAGCGRAGWLIISH